ncbi:MAG: DUF3267 domain-containing protein [Bacilli bacterium]|nr:DUF3267 domain-containing protein [Bacilli bacterium]
MKYFTYKMDLLVLNILAVILITIMIFFTYFITGSISFIDSINVFSLIFIIIILFIHEILHGIGFFILGKVKRKSIVFGAELEKGIFYCMCKEPVSKVNILVALSFPLFFIGILTYIIGIFLGSDLLILLSIFNISGSIGDILMLIDILLMPKDICYLDLDDTTSFTILSKEDLSKKRYFSLKLEKYGKYSDNVKAKDYTKIKVSKSSKWIFIILIIFIIIAFIDLLVT